MAKQNNDTPRVDAITQAGIAKFPRLNTPDDKFSPGDPKFDCQLIVDPNEDGLVEKKPANIIATAEAMRDEFFEVTKKRLQDALAEAQKAKNGDKIKKAKEALANVATVGIGKPEVDDEGEETGKVIIRAKMKQLSKRKDGTVVKRKPVMFDAKGVKLVNQPLVGGGSRLKMAVTMMPYYMASTHEVGVAFYLNAVQIIDLVSGGERSASAYGFGEEEGYESQDESFSADGGESGSEGAGDDF
jgi:hypothetical protein